MSYDVIEIYNEFYKTLSVTYPPSFFTLQREGATGDSGEIISDGSDTVGCIVTGVGGGDGVAMILPMSHACTNK